MDTPDPVSRLNAALQGRYRIERELGEGGMATVVYLAAGTCSLSAGPPTHLRRVNSPDTITRLNAALQGRYRIEREIGEGGMATVYLADDVKHERKVALKVQGKLSTVMVDR